MGHTVKFGAPLWLLSKCNQNHSTVVVKDRHEQTEQIDHKFIPAPTGRSLCLEVERSLLALPARLVGMGLVNSTTECDFEYEVSKTSIRTIGYKERLPIADQIHM
jgi:hypothetical protein